MKKIKELLMKDLIWKLLSVGIAVALWFMVINIENPIENRAYTIPVTFENEDALTEQGLTITNIDDISHSSVLIRVRGDRMALDRLGQYRSSITATVDLIRAAASEGKGEDMPLYIEVKLPLSAGSSDSFEIISKSPQYVTARVEGITTVEKTVQVEVIGDAANGFQVGMPQVYPEIIKITGANSLIEKVDKVKAVVSINSPSEAVSSKVPIILYDKDSKVVDNIIMSENAADVYIPINKAKTIPIKIKSYGEVADGFVLESINVDNEYIEIVGNNNIINEIDEIILPEIDLTDKTDSFNKEFNMSSILPEGISILKNSVNKIVVSVEISKEKEKKITIPLKNIILKGQAKDGFEFSIKSESVEIDIKGAESNLSKLVEEDIILYVDITDIDTDGEQMVEATVDLPENINIVGSLPTVNVSVVNKNIDEDNNINGDSNENEFEENQIQDELLQNVDEEENILQ